jgi:hypothetical protein
MQSMAFTGYGMSNFSGQGLPDLDPNGRLVTGNELIAQRIINRCFCDPGSYLQSGTYGVNVLKYLYGTSQGVTKQTIEKEISDQIKQELMIESFTVVATIDGIDILIVINVTPVSSGNFSLTVAQASNGSNFSIYFSEAA